MKRDHRFELGTRLNVPNRKKLQGLLTARGEDLTGGDYYKLEWIGTNGRPVSDQFWHSEMVAANLQPVRKRNRKPARVARRKR